jgi:hypothetical protein
MQVLRPYQHPESRRKPPTIRADDARYDRRQAAAYLGVKPQTLAAWAYSGKYKLPFYKVGSKSVYLKSALDRFLRSRVSTGG